MKWRSVSSSAKLMVIDLPFEMSTVAFTLSHALLPLIPTSTIPDKDTLLSGLSWDRGIVANPKIIQLMGMILGSIDWTCIKARTKVLPWFTSIVQSPDIIIFGTVVMSTVFVLGGIPRTKEPICPSISNVLVEAEEEDVCATSSKPVMDEASSNNNEDTITRTITADIVIFTIKYHLSKNY